MSAPLRILYLHYLTAGAAGLHHVEALARGLRRAGADVEVAPLHPLYAGADHGGADRNSAAANGDGHAPQAQRVVPHLRGLLREPRELLRNAAYARREARRIETFHPDVLLVRNHRMTASFLRSARRAGCPLVLEMNAPALEPLLYGDTHSPLPLLAERLERRKLRAADRVITVSRALASHLETTHGLDTGSCVIVPNGADPVADAAPPPAACAAATTHRARKPRVGFIGSFQRFHRIDRLAELFCELARRRPDVELVAIGDGPEREAFQAQTRELGRRLRVPGRIPHEDMPAEIAALDVGVLPGTAFYTSPLKVFEFLAAGTPIVVPDTEPLRDLAAAGAPLALFAEQDPGTLTARVEELLDQPQQRAEIANRGRDHLAACLTWDHAARRVHQTCMDAVSSARRAA